MPSELPFPHHDFSKDACAGRFELVPADVALPISHPNSSDIPGVKESLVRAGVAEIILIHGTFAGNDVMGLMRRLSRVAPRVSESMSALGKQWLDQMVGEVGNYTQGYVDFLGQLLSEDERSIGVSRFHWSGENHHLGRVCGAISLLDRLFQQSWNPGDRVLVFAHSHGGNVMAMLSLLLGCSPHARKVFFRATRSLYRCSRSGETEHPEWQRVRESMIDDQRVAALPRIDVATFGTPLRYCWNDQVCQKILHFVQHRPTVDGEPARSGLPRSVSDVINAVGGDYVQHIAIGGTDFLHTPLAWKNWRLERRLRRIFEPAVRRRDLKRNILRGHRVSAQGKTLLVDYAVTPEQWHEKVFGHGVYTLRQWLPFHLKKICDEFYS